MKKKRWRKSGKKTPLDIYRGSVAWGNYRDNEFEYYTNTSKTTATKNLGSYTRIASGAYEGAKANNIYDLAGNVYLWTLDCDKSGGPDSKGYRWLRGGTYDSEGSGAYYASSKVGPYPYKSDSYSGFGGTLYIK